jgi:hypothetical protein
MGAAARHARHATVTLAQEQKTAGNAATDTLVKVD